MLYADFNGLFGDLLRLSHSDRRRDAEGNEVFLRAGMVVTAFEDDLDDEGNPDNLIATGVVEQSPHWLARNGSRWVLRIDQNGVRHESDLADSSRGVDADGK